MRAKSHRLNTWRQGLSEKPNPIIVPEKMTTVERYSRDETKDFLFCLFFRSRKIRIARRFQVPTGFPRPTPFAGVDSRYLIGSDLPTGN